MNPKSFPILPPSVEDFWYLGLAVVLFLAAFLLRKSKGKAKILGEWGTLFIPFYSLPGYFLFLVFKKVGLGLALLGSGMLLLLLPCFITGFSMICDGWIERKKSMFRKQIAFLTVSAIFSLAFLIFMLGYGYLLVYSLMY